MDLELNEKVVCITGGSRGIGLETARAFAAEGAQVIICARREDVLAEAARSIAESTGNAPETAAVDVTEPSDIDRLIRTIKARHARLDVLVNNAGTGIYKPFVEVTEEELQHGMAINFFAQFRVSQRAVPLLRLSTTASIVNVSGRTALRGNFPPGSTCTGPAKAAEVRFSTDLAVELAELGIRVNCVIPGVVKSEDRLRLWEGQAGGAGPRQELEVEAVPGSRGWGIPREVADVIVFLASARANYINGAALVIDGGPHTKSYVTQLHAGRAAPAQGSA